MSNPGIMVGMSRGICNLFVGLFKSESAKQYSPLEPRSGLIGIKSLHLCQISDMLKYCSYLL